MSNNDTVADGKDYVAEFDVPYAMGHAPDIWAAFDDPFRPTTIVIDQEGNIATRFDGPISEDGLRQAIEQLL